MSYRSSIESTNNILFFKETKNLIKQLKGVKFWLKQNFAVLTDDYIRKKVVKHNVSVYSL